MDKNWNELAKKARKICDNLAEDLDLYNAVIILNDKLREVNKIILGIAITHPHLVPWEVEITHEEFELDGN